MAGDVFAVLVEEIDELLESPSAEATKATVSDALTAFDMNPSQLAGVLKVSPASVSRWMSGTVPHHKHLRALQDLVQSRIQPVTNQEGIEFFGRRIGIWGFDAVFRLAKGAKNLYVLKNVLGFQAARSETRRQLKELLSYNKDLRVCYVYEQNSEAETSFLTFRREVAIEWPANIFWKGLEVGHELMAVVGSTSASPFIIEQTDGRIDILIELPTKVLEGLNSGDPSGYMPILVELPEPSKHQLWRSVRERLASIEWESTKICIRAMGEFKDTIVELRDDAYEFLTSSQDESSQDAFDKDSSFVIAEIEGEIVGTIRATDSNKVSPLQAWGESGKILKSGDGVVELTRGVVRPDKRGLGIYKWMMLYTMMYTSRRGFDFATAAVEPDFKLISFLQELGFETVGEQIKYNDLPRRGTVVQPVFCDVKKSEKLWKGVKDKLTKEARTKHVTFKLVGDTEKDNEIIR